MSKTRSDGRPFQIRSTPDPYFIDLPDSPAPVIPYANGVGMAEMQFQDRWARLRQSHDATKFQFVNVELDLAITYCLIAVATSDRARSSRNLANAERAYSAAAYFLDSNLNAGQSLEIKTKLNRFRSLRVSCDGSAQIQ